MANIVIDSRGIRRAVKKYEYTHAIAEYIWNGFDANATSVNIHIDANALGFISEITITDNGEGIPFSKLDDKFRPFLRSEREINPDQARISSKVHGINGVGRLTFFKFAFKAVWRTVYEEGGVRYGYEIAVNSETLNKYDATEPKITHDPIGTSVIFRGIPELTSHNFDGDIKLHLVHEFCWFLALHSVQNFFIAINGHPIDITNAIEVEDNFTYCDDCRKFQFTGRFIQWRERLRTEYSRYYFLDSSFSEKFKKTTTLNNKGDSFYHSLYIQSSFFDNVKYAEEVQSDSDDAQLRLQFMENSDKEIFTRLLDKVDLFLREKRNPYIQKLSENLVKEYTIKGIFPNLGQDEWGKARDNELKNFVRELYIVEPKMFSRLNEEQQKTIVLLLNLVMDGSEKDALFTVLDEVVRLNPEERLRLASVLKTTRLSNITRTISLIRDRIKAVSELRQLIEKGFGASEAKHIQKFLEAHYWLFGEQYHLATAENPDFEEALRRYVFMTTGEDKKQTISHPDKNKEMDIFAVRKLNRLDEIENIVIELKKPTVLLGEEELSQVKGYLRVIKSDARFNGSNVRWTFYLVGNRFDTSGFIEGELESNKNHGERFLVYASGNAKIYVMKWSEVFACFELRYSHLIDELNVERERIIKKYDTPDEIIEAIPANVAAYKNEEPSTVY
jgi:hypothetical protein